MVQQKRYTTSRVRKVCIFTLFKNGQRSPFMGIQWPPLTTSWAASLFCPELRTGYSTRVDLGQNAILDIISAWVRAQCKYHTAGSLQAKTIVTCVRIFWEPSKPLESNWRHNSDIVSGFELCQMIAIVLKFYEFCLHLTKLSPSPFFMALNVKGHHFSQLSYSWRNFRSAFRIEINLAPINPFKLGL